VPLAQKVGPQNVVSAAYDAGIPKSRNLSAVPDIALGPDQVSPLDLADAFATIAAQGKYAQPYLVKSVTTVGGQRIYHAKPNPNQVFDKKVMADTTFAMEHVLQPGGTAYGHALTGRPSAGKTGTTDNNTNAWFTGFTPQLCTSVWIGNVDRNKTVSAGGVGEVFGGTLPAEVWQQMMNAALTGQPAIPFPAPAGVGSPITSSTATASPTAVPTTTVSPPPVTSFPTETFSPPPQPTSTPTSAPSSTPTAPPPSPTPSSSSGFGQVGGQSAPHTSELRHRRGRG
jgi:membrane peptidoglycan carboxypeptidase